ncbi:MAG TPA: DUF2752 domain-containing protein [Pyrinomonadaceae bacterium]|nr:DUF2752 domain-containing protein [Pyrinomonadaceae bacterium]
MKQVMEQTSPTQTFVWPSAREWWRATRWVLLVFTLLVALSIAGSFFSYERVLTEGHPWLPRFHCAGCPLCGMTRAFCALSAGRWHAAVGWNRAAPALYVGFWLWLIAASVYFARALRRKVLARTTT